MFPVFEMEVEVEAEVEVEVVGLALRGSAVSAGPGAPPPTSNNAFQGSLSLGNKHAVNGSARLSYSLWLCLAGVVFCITTPANARLLSLASLHLL